MASGRRSALHPGFGTALHSRSSLLDACLLAAVPLVLVAVFSTSPGVRDGLVLDYGEPTLLTMYTSHFVHQSAGHLLANLAGYALIVPTAYLCFLLADRRRLFRVSFLSFLIALPVGLSALNLVFFRRAVAYGFSGVVMGYFGLLALGLFLYLADRATVPVSDRHAPVAFFIGIAVISVALAPATGASLGIAAAALLGAVLYLRHLTGLLGSVRRLHSGIGATPPGYMELGAVGTLLFLGYPFIAFPADPFQGGAVVNLYTHLLGYALGFISAYTFQVLPGAGTDR